MLGGQLVRIRRRYFIHGLGVLLSAGLALLLLYYPTDRLLQLPAPVRTLLSLGLLTYLGVLLYRFLLYPLQRRFQHGDVALAIEKRFPDLQQKLISAIQLSEQTEQAKDAPQKLRNQSPAMIAKVLDDASEHAQIIPLNQLLNTRRTRQIWILAVLLLILLGSLSVQDPKSSKAFAMRLVGMDVDYPRRTNLEIRLPNNSRDHQVKIDGRQALITLTAGADLIIVVKANGEVPNEVFLKMKGGRGMAPKIAMTTRGKNLFRHVFPRISEGFSFFAQGGDDPAGNLQVTVQAIQPPRTGTLRAMVHPPAYTGQEPTVQTGGNIEALMGSKIILQADTTSPIESATMKFLESGDTIDMETRLVQDDGGQQQLYVAEFLATTTDRYQIELMGKAGLRNPRPGTYQLITNPDHPPLGTLLSPADDNLNVVLPDGIIPIRVEAKDDYGLSKVEAILQWDRVDESEIRTLYATEPDVAPSQRQVGMTLVDLAMQSNKELAVTVGQTMLLTIKVSDNRLPAVEPTMLPKKHVHVVGEQDLMRRISSHFRHIRSEVEFHLNMQDDRHERLLEIMEDLREGTKLRDLQVAITSIEVAQGQMLSAARRIHTEFMRAFNIHLFNRLEPSKHAQRVLDHYATFHQQNDQGSSFLPEFYEELTQMRQDGRIGSMERALDPILDMITRTSRIAKQLAPESLKLLAAARVAAGNTNAWQALESTNQLQQGIITELKALMNRLDTWNEFQDVINDSRSLRDKQREVHSRTLRLQKGAEEDDK